jgi:hypothetical protein
MIQMIVKPFISYFPDRLPVEVNRELLISGVKQELGRGAPDDCLSHDMVVAVMKMFFPPMLERVEERGCLACDRVLIADMGAFVQVTSGAGGD